MGTCSKTIVEAQNPEMSLNRCCPSEKEVFEPESEGFFFCLSLDPICLQVSDYQDVEDLYELENHKYVDPIEAWFQTIVNTLYSLIIFQQPLIPYPIKKLVYHTMECVEAYSLKLSVRIFSILIHTWLHWKYS